MTTSKNSSSNSQSNRISTIVLAAVYLVLILSLVAIALGVNAFFEGQPIETIAVMLSIGFIAMALAGYILFQSRKRVASLKIENPPIITTIECRKCGIKNTREFQRGDYVYKEMGKCQKCDDNEVITAIYREVKEKEKPVTV